MTIQEVSLGTGEGVLWEDESGGEILFAINHGDYTSNHRLRVLPFGNSGSGIYNSPPSGTEANIGQTMDNVMDLLKPLFGSVTSAAFIAVTQVLPDNSGVQPYPYTIPGGANFSAGTASGANWPTFVEGGFSALDTDGGRWQLHLPGMAVSVASTFGRFFRASVGSPIQTLMDYLDGVANGPVHASKTNVVSHAGFSISSNIAFLLATNKRLRRHFRVS